MQDLKIVSDTELEMELKRIQNENEICHEKIASNNRFELEIIREQQRRKLPKQEGL